MNLGRIGILSLVLVGLLLITACTTDNNSSSASEATPTPLPTPIIPEKPTYQVQLGTVVQTLEFTGRVSPVLEQELFFTTGGFVADVLVERGDQVKAGDLLAQLDLSSLQLTLTRRQLSLQSAELRLQEAQATLEQDLADAHDTLDDAQTALTQARNVDTQITRIQAGNDLASAITARDNAQETYDTAWDPARDWELGDPRRADKLVSEREAATAGLQNAENELVLAQLRYTQTMNTISDDLKQLERNVSAAEQAITDLEAGVDPQLSIDVDNAKTDVEETQQDIAAAQLVAPFDGQINSISISSGDNASAYSSVMIIADPTNLEVTAELSSDQLSEMSINQSAVITLRNRPEEPLSGQVRLLPYPYGGGTGEATSDDTAAHIAVDGEPALGLGELASVSIVLQEKENVLWLPPAAIRTFQGRDFVVIQREGGQQRADVLLGVVTNTRVEIVEGVSENDIVVGE